MRWSCGHVGYARRIGIGKRKDVVLVVFVGLEKSGVFFY